MVSRRLGIDTASALPRFPVQPPEHADLHWISPPEDKTTIGIDQIRDLVAEFSLTSYEGTGKVAVIEPANAMTDNAANSLLPATIFSRCQRIDLALPAESEGLAWLDQWQPGTSWSEALRLAGNAPLAAITAIEDLDTHTAMSRDFSAVGRGQASPLEVAARWSKLDAPFVLDWLARQVQHAILRASQGPQAPATQAIDDSVLARMDRRNLFCYLDIINRLRGQPKGSYNVQLTFESLLIDWADGLAQR
jgi:DNA polymerase-3 subunit delta'